MTTRSRAGFTLVELLVSLLLVAMVAGAIIQMLNVVQRTTRTHSERSAMQGALRTGYQLAASEMQELWSRPGVNSDILPSSISTRLQYRAMRSTGMLCQVDPLGVSYRIRRDPAYYSGYQTINTTRHGLLIFSDGEKENYADDDTWVEADLITWTTGTCPDGGPAWVATLILQAGADPADIRNGSPVRAFEQMELGLMTENGRDWLGIRSVSGGESSLRAIAGPLRSGGVEFKYFRNQFSGSTNETGDMREVRMMQLWLHGETARGANRGIGGPTQLLQDSVRIRVNLRNSD